MAKKPRVWFWESGHRSTEMTDKHYSAVANDHEFLLEQARRHAAAKPAK